MILAIDVYYKENLAKTVGVIFNWADEKPQSIIEKNVVEVNEYIPGEFYKRELPCIIELLKEIDLSKISTIIIDGYVYIDNDKNYGLGGYLYDYLKEKIPIIGVAKTSFHNTEKVTIPIFRGESQKPLFISSVGINLKDAAEKVKSMNGNYRIPNILKELDQLTKTENNHF